MIKLPSLGFDDVHDNDGELELCNRLKAARAEAGLDVYKRQGMYISGSSPCSTAPDARPVWSRVQAPDST